MRGAGQTRYVSRIAKERTELTTKEAEARVRPFILKEYEQNKMHLYFNKKLRGVAEKIGARYFDFTQETAVREGEVLRLADVFRPGQFDHHLANTLRVRSMHYEGAGKVFGL